MDGGVCAAPIMGVLNRLQALGFRLRTETYQAALDLANEEH